MTKPFLQIKNLKVAYKIGNQEVRAVRGIDLNLRDGESVGIIGESSCGKSSIAKAILKLLPSNASMFADEFSYLGRKIDFFSETEMRSIRGKEIAMIFQDPFSSLNPTQKVGKQIVEGFFCHFKNASFRDGKKAAIQILEEVGFINPEEIMEAYPHSLSGGMRQRIIIALALVCRPRILLADEPTTSLDTCAQDEILTLLKSFQRHGNMGIVFITHDMRIIKHFCDRVLVMYAGKIVESASVEAIFTNPQHPYTQKLIASIPHRDHPKEHPLPAIEGFPPSLTLPLMHCGFCSRCPAAMNICAEASPGVYPISDEHWSACFMHDKRGKE